MNESKSLGLKMVDIDEAKADNDKKVKRLLDNMQYFINAKFPNGVPYDLMEQDIVVLSSLARRGVYDAVGVIRLAYEYGMAKGATA